MIDEIGPVPAAITTGATVTGRRIEHVMGTAITFDVRTGPTPIEADTVERAIAWLHHVDELFSTYRPDSQISRIGRGDLSLAEADPDVIAILERCADLRDRTDGAFDHRPGGPGLDPSGIVKGWSIDRAALDLRIAGAQNFCIDGGGDVLGAGEAEPGRLWHVGIRHPRQPGASAAILRVGNQAVATSATYERGDHIWGCRGARLLSVTVIGRELGLADALATAAFAEGSGEPPWLDRFPGYELLAITRDERVRWTLRLDDRVVAPLLTA